MELKGRFPVRMLRAHVRVYTELLLLDPHFLDVQSSFKFQHRVLDERTKEPRLTLVSIDKPTRSIAQTFLSKKAGADDKRTVLDLADFLEQVCMLNRIIGVESLVRTRSKVRTPSARQEAAGGFNRWRLRAVAVAGAALKCNKVYFLDSSRRWRAVRSARGADAASNRVFRPDSRSDIALRYAPRVKKEAHRCSRRPPQRCDHRFGARARASMNNLPSPLRGHLLGFCNPGEADMLRLLQEGSTRTNPLPTSAP